MYFLTLSIIIGLISVISCQASDHISRPVHCQSVCDINICFSVQGSDVILPGEFRNQIEVVGNVVYLLHNRGGSQQFAAVQYGIINSPISSLTEIKEEFLQNVSASTQSSEMGSFPTAGLNYCFGELHQELEGPRIIVFFGNGISTIGSEPTDRAALFRNTGGSIISVGVGQQQDRKELERIAGNGNGRVFNLVQNLVWNTSVDIAQLVCPF